jgi:CheY-like chemotaxis protein/HPt (histidine-containing phosphotransfer) domain-containing protein
MEGGVSSLPAPPDIPTLLDEAVLGRLHEDFASTGDLPELAGLISSFIARAGDQLAIVESAVQAGEPQAIRAAAHKLKGSSRTLGASLLGAVAAKLEAAGDAGDVPAARRSVADLEVVFALSRSGLADMIDAIDGSGSTEPRGERGVGLRALLVDDEPVALAVLRASVERLGHDCAVAIDGHAALAEYRRARPDVVITDFHMPAMGGIELAEQIRAGGDRSTYIVVLSASGGRSDDAIGVTVDAGLSKPIREDELRAVLGLAARRVPVA